MRAGLVLLLLLATTLAHATVYKWVDENGKVHFSDKPVKNAEVVELNENTQNNIKLPDPVVLPDLNTADDTDKASYKLNIASPSEEETIRNNEGEITLIAKSHPQLSPAHEFVLFMDGQQLGSAQKSGLFKLSDIDRGEHSFVVKVLSKNGKQLATTPPRKVFLHRTHLNQPKYKRPQPRTN
ncbi:MULTISPECIES: DUF4124 domain-containing protein [unclassified Shewanella]|uniref:DUF4124 domain-containing protein n=1 Tax=unclassified Shewanella TaxID=196818 RepID=UPI001BC4E752|nr:MULTISPECIES: DUF4124 domain-containing protein [unclassified Shewanella]GIU11204.1 hypothetical protein TUM4444_16710 [Shewanella sp. MBTL60-112-B1]GIU30883.1 hypothetical protein TUM4445_14690 [Shewanella sp. MBTL60-112-B2]